MPDVAVAERPRITCDVCGGEVLTRPLRTCSLHLDHELGITYRQLNHWVIRGYLRPDHARRTSGIARTWPEAELEVARRMARLTAAGISPEVACKFARESWPSGEIAPGITLSATSEEAPGGQ